VVSLVQHITTKCYKKAVLSQGNCAMPHAIFSIHKLVSTICSLQARQQFDFYMKSTFKFAPISLSPSILTQVHVEFSEQIVVFKKS